MGDVRQRPLSRVALVAGRLGVTLVVLCLLAAGTLASPRFLTFANLINIVDGVMLLGIVVTGMAFVTYSGHYADLSVPTTMAFAGVVAVEFLRFGFVQALLGGLGVGLAVGLVNAAVVGRLRANPILWTLAMSYVTKGLMRWLWLNRQIYPDVKSGATGAGQLFVQLYRQEVLGKVTLPMVVLVAMAIAAHCVLRRTVFGHQLKLVGANPEVARLSGVPVARTVGLAFVLSALAAALAGLFITSLSKVGAYYNGEGYDFDAVTAIVIGGMTLSGGRGGIGGALGGVLVIGLMGNLMTLLGIDTFSQRIVKGLVFIAAVGLSAAVLRRLGRDDT
jgi:ribose/xylose/arabinose/galactoside ABC-type transport system permease subunit